MQYRYTLLSLAALEAPLQLEINGSTYGDDCVFIANDWHAAMVPVYLAAKYRPGGVYLNSRAILAIHNLRHQVGTSGCEQHSNVLGSPFVQVTSYLQYSTTSTLQAQHPFAKDLGSTFSGLCAGCLCPKNICRVWTPRKLERSSGVAVPSSSKTRCLRGGGQSSQHTKGKSLTTAQDGPAHMPS